MTRGPGILFVVLVGCANCAETAHDGSTNAQLARTETAEAESPFTQREIDLIRSQVEENWVVDIGMPGLEKMAATIVVE
ncbi:MAG: hypothetical protein ACREA0_20460 [bacterium]